MQGLHVNTENIFIILLLIFHFPIHENIFHQSSRRDSNLLTVTLLQNEEEEESESDHSYDILDILNRDCLTHILSYVPIRDLIRSERVSKRWHNVVQEYLQGK